MLSTHFDIGYTGPGYIAQSIKDAIDYGQAKGVIYVFSATNGNNEGRMYPAAYAGVVAVTNVDYKGVRHRPRGFQIFNPTSMCA